MHLLNIKWNGTLTTKEFEDEVNVQYIMTQKTSQTNSSDSDEVSNYMNKWRKKCKDVMTSDESDSCSADSDSSFIVETCDEDEDNLSFYLQSLNKAQIPKKKQPSSHQDFGSINEKLPCNNNQKLVNTSPLTKSLPFMSHLT